MLVLFVLFLNPVQDMSFITWKLFLANNSGIVRNKTEEIQQIFGGFGPFIKSSLFTSFLLNNQVPKHLQN